MAVGRVCRDEGAGRVCMRGTYATRDIQVGSMLFDLAAWLPSTAVPQSSCCQALHEERDMPRQHIQPHICTSIFEVRALFACSRGSSSPACRPATTSCSMQCVTPGCYCREHPP